MMSPHPRMAVSRKPMRRFRFPQDSLSCKSMNTLASMLFLPNNLQVTVEALGGGVILLAGLAYVAFSFFPKGAPWVLLIAGLVFLVVATDTLDLSMGIFTAVDVIILLFLCMLFFHGKSWTAIIVGTLVGVFTLIAIYQRYMAPLNEQESIDDKVEREMRRQLRKKIEADPDAGNHDWLQRY